jgi:hypothetical protein
MVRSSSPGAGGGVATYVTSTCELPPAERVTVCESASGAYVAPAMATVPAMTVNLPGGSPATERESVIGSEYPDGPATTAFADAPAGNPATSIVSVAVAGVAVAGSELQLRIPMVAPSQTRTRRKDIRRPRIIVDNSSRFQQNG